MYIQGKKTKVNRVCYPPLTAFIGCRSEYGGVPSIISMAVMPRLHISALELYLAHPQIPQKQSTAAGVRTDIRTLTYDQYKPRKQR